MKEISLHYIWQHQLFYSFNLSTVYGEKISILSKGEYNKNSGPDFLNAKIFIDGILFVGNIEIHILSSDWNKHLHDKDSSYDNVILHVVLNHDKDIKNSKGISIPTLELKFLMFPDLTVIGNKNKNPSINMPICKQNNFEIDEISQSEWLKELYLKRVTNKINEIRKIYQKTNERLDDTIYFLGAKTFGCNINSTPFELIADNLPLSFIKQFINDDITVESLFFGAAGFLNYDSIDDYHDELKLKFIYSREKYNLKSLNSSIWKFSRMHPQNFPTIRITEFIQFIKKIDLIVSGLKNENPYLFWRELLQLNLSAYWQQHYYFGKKISGGKISFGKTSIDLIIINCIVPMIFFIADLKSSEKLYENAIEIMNEIIPEKNSITKNFTGIISKPKNAIETQGLNFLYKELCLQTACKNCLIGNKILNLNF